MNARHERKLRTLAVIVAASAISAIPERGGVVDCRPLRCFVAMRTELARASDQFEREFGAAPHIRGSLHSGR